MKTNEKEVKHYRYRVTAVRSKKDKPNLKVDDVLFYKRGRGPFHSETIMNTKGEVVETWDMEAIGPAWSVGNKVVRTVDYPTRSK